MAKKSTKASSSARQAKIQAAQKSSGGGVDRITAAAVVVIVAIIATVGGVIWSQQSREAAITGGGDALPTGVDALGEGYPAFADVTPIEGAPTLDLYEDFQCPACADFEARLGDPVTGLARDGRIRLVYHVKNFLDDTLRNDSSTRAGNAAFCASDAGRFQEFHDQVFPNQPATEGDGFTDEQLRGLAEQAGIQGEDLATWQACHDAGTYVDYVNSVEEQSFADGVRGTPTVRIDGQDVELSRIGTPELLTQAVENATS